MTTERRRHRAAAYRKRQAELRKKRRAAVPKSHRSPPETHSHLPRVRIPRLPVLMTGDPEPAFFCEPCATWHPILWRRISPSLHPFAPTDAGE